MNNEDLETRIRERAYLLWLMRGSPRGVPTLFGIGPRR